MATDFGKLQHFYFDIILYGLKATSSGLDWTLCSVWWPQLIERIELGSWNLV
jgi:hypothetical protein